MNQRISKELDPFTLPLHGERLIEASAGTGKTFTIGLLYLRILLGLGDEAAFSRPLSIEEILVVTFTEAATAELRSRIRANIHQLRIACMRGNSLDPGLQPLLTQISDYGQAASVLLAAERQMDKAGIFTIHGFCQRMLNLNAFESGIFFEQKLIEDEMPLHRRAVGDFWRRHCYPLSLPIARVVSRLWSGPEQLLKTLSPWLMGGEVPTLKLPMNRKESIEQHHEKIISRIDALKQAWLAAGDLCTLVETSNIDRRSYNGKHLHRWIEKISQWAHQVTENYEIPKDLERFGQRVLLNKTKKGTPPRHTLFEQIDIFLSQPLSLRDLVIAHALKEVRHVIQQEKHLHAQLGFDDLLGYLDTALQQHGGDGVLAAAIRQRYPVALIDEFQDTDPQQYRIFKTIYVGQPNSALLLIGDPKQAIYAFRGANIFAYMQARAEVRAHYTMRINWRSSPDMVEGVNQLFLRQAIPFLFREIPFISVNPTKLNISMNFSLDGKPQPALQFWLQDREGIGVRDYQQFMARQCAAQIARWLSAGQQGMALIGRVGKQCPIQASDITILVRNCSEAKVIREELDNFSIPSAYLSNRDSVFATQEAREMLLLLQAVLSPEQEKVLRSMLASSIFGLDALVLDALARDEHAWDALFDEFAAYRQHWLKRGVMPMLHKLMAQRHMAENLLASDNGERRLTDLLHLGELLQEASAIIDTPHGLVRWLARQIQQPDGSVANQQLRLESDRHLVHIVTIHKSKGLQYPLVWLPFAANFREANSGVYHDRQSYQALLDLQKGEESIALADQERLAEDLRLLYVALTRSVYHCSLGIAPLIKGTRKKEGNSDMHRSALGYLVQQGEVKDAAGLRSALEALCSNAIALIVPTEPAIIPWRSLGDDDVQTLSCQQLPRSLHDDWRITSYSDLHQNDHTTGLYPLPRLRINAADDEAIATSLPQLTPHTFPRGATSGTFLHSLFETLEFTEAINEDWLRQKLSSHGLNEAWLPVMLTWIEHILKKPLNDSGVSLQQLPPHLRRVELQFYLPIERLLTADTLNVLMLQDPLSASCPPLHFYQVQGMLKGFIDLVFYWQGKYYLLDYKSNWLGEDSSSYTHQAMTQAMKMHRYDLQYQLYTLALHRYMRHRLLDYDYQHHFGGVIYLFLRGLDGTDNGHGIYSTRPEAAFIESLDTLFSPLSASENER